MFSPDELNAFLEKIKDQLSRESETNNINTPVTGSKNNTNNNCNKNMLPAITPQKVLVILGLLAGVLEVRSILVDRDQAVEILLDGSLKRKTGLDKMLDEIGAMPFDRVLEALIGRVC